MQTERLKTKPAPRRTVPVVQLHLAPQIRKCKVFRFDTARRVLYHEWQKCHHGIYAWLSTHTHTLQCLWHRRYIAFSVLSLPNVNFSNHHFRGRSLPHCARYKHAHTAPCVCSVYLTQRLYRTYKCKFYDHFRINAFYVVKYTLYERIRFSSVFTVSYFMGQFKFDSVKSLR